MRTLRLEANAEEQIARLGIGYKRFDELMAVLELTLCRHPEAFPVLSGTRLSLCRTNEFAGMSFADVPRLSIYFIYDDEMVYLFSVEESESDSYGI